MTNLAQKTKPHDRKQSLRLIESLPRHANVATETDSQENNVWAVSYSDLLMVMLSFFILFFSFEDRARVPDSLQKIASMLSNDKTANPSGGGGTGMAGGALTASNPTGEGQSTIADSTKRVDKLAERLSDFLGPVEKVVTDGNLAEGLLVQFSGDVFKSGRWTLDADLTKRIDLFIGVILNHKDDIKIEVIGETDSRPVSLRPGSPVTDNYVLSSLRASSVVDYLIKRGFPPNNLKAVGVAGSKSGRRSVSILVSSREVAPRAIKVEAR